MTFGSSLREARWLETDRFDITQDSPRDAAFGSTEPNSMTDAQRKTYTERVRSAFAIACRAIRPRVHTSQETSRSSLNRRERRSEMKVLLRTGSPGNARTGRGHTQATPSPWSAWRRISNHMWRSVWIGRPRRKIDWTLDWSRDSPAPAR